MSTIQHSGPKTYRSFNDPRVFVCPSTDPDEFMLRQEHDGPTYLMVGHDVKDERLLRYASALADRCGVTLEQLQQARGSRGPA